MGYGLLSVLGEGISGYLPMALYFGAPLLTMLFVVFSYWFLNLGAGKEGAAKDDQVGIKLVLFAFLFSAILIASFGVNGIAYWVMNGFKEPGPTMKGLMPPIIVGGLVFVVVRQLLLPRTNNATAHGPERMMLGALGVIWGVVAIFALGEFLSGLFRNAPWERNSAAFATLVVGILVTGYAVVRLGSLSGWVAPTPPAPPAQQSSGMPPQGGGYPPQGGGYPPQGGGYPPQGGGYGR